MKKYNKANRQAEKIKKAKNKNKAIRKWCKLMREALNGK